MDPKRRTRNLKISSLYVLDFRKSRTYIPDLEQHEKGVKYKLRKFQLIFASTLRKLCFGEKKIRDISVRVLRMVSNVENYGFSWRLDVCVCVYVCL